MGIRIDEDQSESVVQAGTLKNCRSLLGEEHVERQNTGGMYDATGRFVRFGRKGNSDVRGFFPAGWGEASGRTLAIECKKGGWKPPKPAKPGARKGKDRLRWESQAARLRTINAAGGYGFWVNEKNAVIDVLLKIKQGWRVELGADDEVLLIEPRGTDA